MGHARDAGGVGARHQRGGGGGPVMAGPAVPRPDEPGRPPADPGPHDAPQEAALDTPHLDNTPAVGPEPTGPRDPELADEGPPVDLARAEPSAFGRDVTPGPGPVPILGAPS